MDLLTHEGYLKTKDKLANMERRLTTLRARTDLSTLLKWEVEHSYLDMMRQYLRDIKLYEAAHGMDNRPAEPGPGGTESKPSPEVRE